VLLSRESMRKREAPMGVAHGTAVRPVLVPSALSAALMLGLVARVSGEQVFGAFATAFLLVAVAAGAGEALSGIRSRSSARFAYLLPATTALGFYAAGGGIPHLAAIVLVGVALAAGAAGQSKAWPSTATPVMATSESRSIEGQRRAA
jgi:hypothetical protein